MQKNSVARKKMLILRRLKQLHRVPDNDARIVYFSKNSLPEYRKN